VTAQQPTPPTLLLIETHTIDVDPVVGRFVDRALQRGAQSAGYAVLPTDEGRKALRDMGAADPPSVVDLGRAAYRVHAERGVLAAVWATHGRYVVQVQVAHSDGSAPSQVRGDAGSEDLEQQVGVLLARVLAEAPAPPKTLETPRAAPETAPVAPETAPVVKPQRARSSERAAATPNPRAEPIVYRLALHDDVAFGIAKHSFLADVIGGRLDLRVDTGSWLGAHLGYADLPGRQGRAHSLLMYAQFEQRIPIAAGPVGIPLRFDLGYLLRNGGFLRLSSGLAFALGKRVELVLDLLAPTFWITPDNTLFSLDLGFELAVTF
jgi:hypothetical protein